MAPLSSPKREPPQVNPIRYFKKLRLRNVRTFRSDTHLDFCFPNGRLAQWTVLLGENGTGKTTVLQELAAMQPEQEAATQPPVKSEVGKETEIRPGTLRPVGANPNWFGWHAHNLPRPWDKPMTMEVALELTSPHVSIRRALQRMPDSKLKDSDKFNQPFEYNYSLSFGDKDGTASITASMRVPMNLEFFNQYFVLGYGANRHVAGPSSPYLASEEFGRRLRGSTTNTLFNDEQPLISPEQWLLGLDHSSKAGSKSDSAAKHSLQRAIECLKRVLPDVSEILIKPFAIVPGATPMTVLFKTPYGIVPFGGLSLGYKSMAAWLIDFVQRMNIRYGHLPRPESGPAVVLIDEFDLHMHPKWQMQAMSILGKLFPNTQFIVTAHSPLIVQAAGENANLALLRKVKLKNKTYGIVIDNEPVHIRGWRLDQITTSDLYGIKSSRNQSYQKLFERRATLLRKKSLTDKQKTELSKLTQRLDREAPPGTSESGKVAERLFRQLLKAKKSSHDKA